MLGIVKFEKQTDGTRRRMLRADPDVESGFKELIMLRGDYNILRKRTSSLQNLRADLIAVAE